MSTRLRHETDIEHLREVALMQDAELRRLAALVVKLKKENAELRGEPLTQQMLDGLFKAEVLKLQKAAEQAPNPGTNKRRQPLKTRTTFGPIDQSDLLTEVHVVELDEADKICPECGVGLAEMEGQFDRSELIDVIEVQYKRVLLDAQKYRCPKGCCIEQPLTVERLIPGGRYSRAFGAKVAADKYCHHIPLARQSRMMKEHGLTVPRHVLWNQLKHMAKQLTPVWMLIQQQIMSKPVIGLDQTGWPNLARKAGKNWQMWCLTAPGLVAHLIKDDKSIPTFEAITESFSGTIVSDMLRTHISAAARAGPRITLAACWAHVRRKFAESEADFPQARIALNQIRQIYDLERDVSDMDARRSVRDTQTRKVVGELKNWLDATSMPKTTSLGAAIRYATKHWQFLSVFLDDPEVPLDNNATERGVRGPVVGRRNHFGSKSRAGTKVAAVLYTLIECAKLSNVPPAEYLCAALESARLGTALTPAAYAQTLATPN